MLYITPKVKSGSVIVSVAKHKSETKWRLSLHIIYNLSVLMTDFDIERTAT